MKNLNFVTERAYLEKILAGRKESLGFFCPHCFAEVHKSSFEGIEGAQICWCECYSRVFEKERLESLKLDLKQWNAYIISSPNRAFSEALNRGANQMPLVNAISGSYDIWCPGCERPRKLAGKGIWLRKSDQQLVCVYGICRRCMKNREQMTEGSEASVKLVDAITERLTERYPFLESLIRASE